jgi:long-chain acyl-CoA synthetase
LNGGIVGITPGVREIIADLQEFRPHFFLSVPRVYDRLYAELVDNAPPSLFGMNYRRKLKLAFSDKVPTKFAEKIRELLGGQLHFTFTTAVKPDPQLIKFFTNLQIPSYDCYFVTEAKGIVAMNTTEHNRIGTVGQVLPHREVQIVDDVINVDGFATGDLGELDAQKFLTITGHKKDVIITSSGRSISPEPLQQALATDPIISDALVIGERRPYLTALIALNSEHVQKLMVDCNIDVDSVEGAVMIDKLVQKGVNNANKIAGEDEKIVRYAILEDGFPAYGEFISGSLKLRRDTLCKHYKQLINDVLYS